jgi:hypothetical protein
MTVFDGAAVYYRSGSANDMARQIENMFKQNDGKQIQSPSCIPGTNAQKNLIHGYDHASTNKTGHLCTGASSFWIS